MKLYVRFLLKDFFVHLYPLIISLVRLHALVTDLDTSTKVVNMSKILIFQEGVG